jgi:DNA-binding beta-propeller fold protein YncE
MLARRQDPSVFDFWVHALAGAAVIAAMAAALALAGCEPGKLQAPGGPDPGGGSTMPPPAPPPPLPPPPSAPVYVRGSLQPLYQLTPRSEYGRIVQAGVTMSDADFTTSGTLTSSASKMDELAAQLARESGVSTTINLIPDAADRQRAQLIPFRGNPSDVKFTSVNGAKKLYIPLGGDVQTPGNEVAVVQDGQLRTRVKVGIRPQRVAVHPAGLIFVCNQYSNYISIIDPTNDQPLTKGGQPVEIKTEYFCSDLMFVAKTPQAPNPDQQTLYVANRWRHSVLEYQANIVRDPLTNRPVDVIQSPDANPSPANKPVAEIIGVGNNPWRLALSEQQDTLYVANNKGGELASIDLRTGTATARMALGAPSVDVVNIRDLLFVPTTMPDRGLLYRDEPHPQQVVAPAIHVTGIDNNQHVAHPGAIFDSTRSYNFEDVRNGLSQIDFRLSAQLAPTYYTDDNSSEPNFVAQQKVLAGAIPQGVVRNAAGDRIFVALAGSDLVQELAINTASRPFTVSPVRTFQVSARPFGLALDEQRNQLYVATWGGETLDVIDLGNGTRTASIDLGYAQPQYPATNIEKGEYFFYNASWANNGRKACATCHLDELDTDGVGYSNGAEAPTAYHQVKPNHNLATTNSYFWNGSFGDGNYTSLAFAAQTRTNCELVELGLIEGPGSNPQTRVGDPNNQYTNGQDANCRPVSAGPSALANQDTINQVVAAEKQIADQGIQRATGLDRESLSRVIDFYSVAELRLPPNPLRQMYNAMQLDSSVQADIQAGKMLFVSAGCSTCHDPNDARHPFADGLDHGAGADWTTRFVQTYQNDPRLTGIIASFPQTMLDAISAARADHEVNIYYDPLDYFIPFCFEVTNCLEFDDPLAVRGNTAEESRRLDLLVRVNLADPDRGFIPGNVRGQAKINTPSLRGVWTQANLLHHGLGHTIREAILGPGHPALAQGETGFAIDALGNFDVHGTTRALSADQIRQVIRYVEAIE